MLTKLFTAFVRPTLEYIVTQYGGPSLFLIKGKWRKSNVGLHVSVLPSLRDKLYEERL